MAHFCKTWCKLKNISTNMCNPAVAIFLEPQGSCQATLIWRCVLPRNFKIHRMDFLHPCFFSKSSCFAFLSSFCSLRIHPIAGDLPPVGSKNPPIENHNPLKTIVRIYVCHGQNMAYGLWCKYHGYVTPSDLVMDG